MPRKSKIDTKEEAVLSSTSDSTAPAKKPRKKKASLKLDYRPDTTDALSEAGDDLIDDSQSLDDSTQSRIPDLSTPKGVIRMVVNLFYQTQKRRIALGNQLLALVYTSLGFASGKKIDDEELKEKSKGFLDRMESEFYSIHEQIVDMSRAKMIKWFAQQDALGLQYIRTIAHYTLVETYMAHKLSEHKLLLEIKACLEEHPIWTRYLVNVKGCGPLTSAMLISYLDIHKAVYPSCLISYCGYGVIAVQNPDDPDNPKWEGQSRKKTHLKEVDYVAKDGSIQKKLSCGFNPKMKTTLYKLATCFLKQNPEYKAMYDGYKHRQQQINAQRPENERRSNAHLHAMAMRYIAKEFLKSLYNVWRPMEGLSVALPFEQGKLGMKPHKQDWPLGHPNAGVRASI